MEIKAYCPKCTDDKEHSVEKVLFFGRKIELKLDCGHSMVVWGVALTEL
jgi:hypothetical protein